MSQANIAFASESVAQKPVDLAIVILNYNTRVLLRDCLRSLQACAQALSVEVVIVDNASSDGSAALVRDEFPAVQLIVNQANVGYSAGNNVGLRSLGSINWPHTCGFATALCPAAQSRHADAATCAGGHGAIHGRSPYDWRGRSTRAPPRRQPGSGVPAQLPHAAGELLSHDRGSAGSFPRSRRFNAYNLEYLPEDAVHPVDSVVGAYMQVRREAILAAGLLDESFFMYGEDLDWAKRIKDAGWEVWYNGTVEITHVKEAASRQSAKSRIDFYEAMWLFYQKHYQRDANWLLDKVILTGIVVKGRAGCRSASLALLHRLPTAHRGGSGQLDQVKVVDSV
jgi:N-acetylglucosaminyl-diphospho-decaprenol L-rhamnosyltransferase